MNLEPLTEALKLLENSRVAELEIESEEGSLLRIRRTPRRRAAAPATSHAAAESFAEETASTLLRVEAGLVGRYHVPMTPIAAGDEIQTGDVLGAIESMGLMNAVVATQSGRVAEVHVEDGQPVEYGQLLFELEPA